MRWTKSGQEYDEAYRNIKLIKEIYLFGAGHDGRMVASILSKRYPGLSIKGFIDNNSDLWNTTVDGYSVFPPSTISVRSEMGVVITFASEFTEAIDLQLQKMGFELGINMWHYEEFVSVYALYEHNEVFFSSICILPTDACNLKCKACLNFTKYIGKFTNQPIEKLKNEIDLYFNTVDYTGLFFISGGEPFLYPFLPELIEYIDDNYREKMYEFGIVTNGTIMPSDNLFSVLKKSKIIVTFDDYRDAIPELKERITKNYEYICEIGIEGKILLRKYEEWISLYPHKVRDESEEVLRKKYDECHCPWQEYKNGCLFSCNYASFAYNAGIDNPDMDNEVFCLKDLKRRGRKELIEFRLGYTKKGYVEFCKMCVGYMDINPYKVRAAEQEV